MVIEILVILGWDNAANANEDIAAAPVLQFFHQGWKQCLVSCSQRGEANNMNIVIYGILGRFIRNRGPTSTSQPMSAKEDASTFWPLS